MKVTPIIAVLLCSTIELSLAQDGGSNFILSGKSFGLRSLITVFESRQNSVIKTVKVEEIYDHKNKRARIHYAISDANLTAGRKSEFFNYDADTEIGVVYPNNLGWCRAEPLTSLADNLFKASSDLAILMQPPGSLRDDPQVVGPARLLFIIAEHIDELKDEMQLYAQRNHLTHEYSLDLRLNGTKFTFGIFYESPLGETPAQEQVPLMILVTSEEHYLSVDYFDHTIIRDDHIHSTGHAKLDESAVELVLDPFALPVGIGCLSSIGGSQRTNLFEPSTETTARLSFSAVSDYWPDQRVYRHFLAYDGLNSAIRVDSKRLGFKHEDTHDRTRLYDMRNNRKYLVELEDRLSADALSLVANDRPNKCAVTYIRPPTEADGRVPVKFAPYLTGGDEFIYVGNARVRGVDAEVYESVAKKLPEWFSDPMVYRTADDKFGLRDRGVKLKDDKGDADDRQLSVVVYMTGKAFPKLLMMDIYDLKQTTSSYNKVLTIKFDDFAWTLNGAPNGDKPRDLFNHQSLCSNEDAKVAELDVLLESPSSFDESLDWIDNPRERNHILRSGLADSLGLRSIMIFDVESRVSTKPKSTIAATLRLAQHASKLIVPTFLGRAGLLARPLGLRTFAANTLSDCFWSVGALFRKTLVYYSQDTKTCSFDASGETDSRQPLLRGIFALTQYGEGELFELAALDDPKGLVANQIFDERDPIHLRGRTVVLQNFAVDQETSDPSLTGTTLHVARAKVRPLNHKSSSRASDARLAGFCLPERSPVGRRVKARQEDQTVSWALCEAACLSDFECKSFAYCDHEQEPTCTLVSVDLVTDDVRGQLAKLPAHKLASGFTTRVRSQQIDFDLVHDHSCDIYPKSYTKMFIYEQLVVGSLSDRDEVFRVASKESCAERCFGKSLAAVEESGSLDAAIAEKLRSREKSGDEMPRLYRRHRQLVDEFCFGFNYIQSTLSQDKLEAIERLVRNGDNAPAKGAYCILSRPLAELEDAKYAKMFPSESYQFDFTSLYEKKVGYNLMGSRASEELSATFDAALHGTLIGASQIVALEEALKSGANFELGLGFTVDAVQCARQCFLQSAGVWPGCRSFDLATYGNSMEILSTTCKLNSQRETNETIFKFDPTMSSKAYHYEPRFALVSGTLDDGEMLGRWIEWRAESLAGSPVGGLALFALIVVSVVAGLLLGARMSPQVVAFASGNRRNLLGDFSNDEIL